MRKSAGQSKQGNGGEPPSPLFFKIGSATFTPLGFVDLTNVFRAPVIGSGIGTNFGAVPYRIGANFPGAGLTDLEISEMTRWFLEHTVEDQGFRRVVEPVSGVRGRPRQQ